jgi:exo-beta-1,3-glucanase (GH17 family)
MIQPSPQAEMPVRSLGLYGATFVPFNNVNNTIDNIKQALRIAYKVTNRFRLYTCLLLEKTLQAIDELGYNDVELYVGVGIYTSDAMTSLEVDTIMNVLSCMDGRNITYISFGNEYFQFHVNNYAGAYDRINRIVDTIKSKRDEIFTRTGRKIKLGVDEVFGFYTWQFGVFAGQPYTNFMNKLDFCGVHIHPLYSYGSDLTGIYAQPGNRLINANWQKCNFSSSQSCAQQFPGDAAQMETQIPETYTSWFINMYNNTVKVLNDSGLSNKEIIVSEWGLPSSGAYVPMKSDGGPYNSKLLNFTPSIQKKYRENVNTFLNSQNTPIKNFYQAIFDNYAKLTDFEKAWGLYSFTNTQGNIYTYVNKNPEPSPPPLIGGYKRRKTRKFKKILKNKTKNKKLII